MLLCYNFSMKIIKARPKTYVKEIFDNNNVLRRKSRYIKSTNVLVKDVFFQCDGKTVSSITKYDSKTVLPKKDIFFDFVGKYFGGIDYEDIKM